MLWLEFKLVALKAAIGATVTNILQDRRAQPPPCGKPARVCLRRFDARKPRFWLSKVCKAATVEQIRTHDFMSGEMSRCVDSELSAVDPAAPTIGYCATCSLRTRSVCAGFSKQERAHAERFMAHRFVAKGRAIMREGEPNTFLFVIVEGSIRLSKILKDGRRQITGFRFPGDFLGVRLNRECPYTAESLEDCVLCCFPHAFIDHAAKWSPIIKDRLIKSAEADYHKAQDHIVLLGKQTAEERLMSFLHSLLAMGRKGSSDEGIVIPLSMSRGDIADYLGLRFETLSRTFTLLKKKGVLSHATRRSCVFHPSHSGRERPAVAVSAQG